MSTESMHHRDDTRERTDACSRSPCGRRWGTACFGAVRGELRRGWHPGVGLDTGSGSACAVLWLNLSWSAANRIEEFNRTAAGGPSIRSPRHSSASWMDKDEQALSFALTLRAAACIDPCPEVRPPPVAGMTWPFPKAALSPVRRWRDLADGYTFF